MAVPDTINKKEEKAAQEARGLHARMVKSRAISGIKVMALRTGASVLLRVVSSLFLAHLLFPKDYGVFAIAAYLTGLGGFLSDVGLGGALIRQTEKPTADETFTVFFSQQSITAMIVATIIIASPVLVHIYGLSHAATVLLATMSAGLFFNSLRVVPMMALERDLQYSVIARCELIENLVQTGSTIALAALGCGAWALAGGGLLRGAVGLACIWAASPWRPRGTFRFDIVRRLAKFGIAFQLNALAPTVLGGWMPLVVGRLLGVAAVGLVGWATNIASVPLMLSGVLNRVAFPAYSRLQSDPEALVGYLRASVRRLNVILCLVVPVVVIVCPVAIPALFGHRWTAAITLVQWFSVEIVLLSLNGLLCATQNATGFAADRLWVALGMGTLRAGLGWWAIAHFGLMGLGPAVCAASFVELFISTWAVIVRHPHARPVWPEIFRPLLVSGAALAVAECVARLLVAGQTWLGLTQALAVLGTFVLLMAAHEAMSRSRVILTELRGLARMLRPVSEGVL